MSRQNINVGMALKDGKGDNARTGMSKVNANFVELYSFINGADSDVLPSALPISRGGTGASTVASARLNLGLGEAATLPVGDGVGDVVVVGSFGLGTETATQELTAAARKPSELRTGELVYYMTPKVSSVTMGSADNGLKVQLGAVVSDKPVAKVRGSTMDGFANWYDLFGSSNCIVTMNGDIKLASNALKVYASKVEAMHGTAHSITRSALGVYTVTGVKYSSNMWGVVAGKDAKGVALYDVAVAQSGANIKVTVTKNGAAYDIPVGDYISIHIE